MDRIQFTLTTTPSLNAPSSDNNVDNVDNNNADNNNNNTINLNSLSTRTRLFIAFLVLLILKIFLDNIIECIVVVTIGYSLHRMKNTLDMQLALKDQINSRMLMILLLFNITLLIIMIFTIQLLSYTDGLMSRITLQYPRNDKSSGFLNIAWCCLLTDAVVRSTQLTIKSLILVITASTSKNTRITNNYTCSSFSSVLATPCASLRAMLSDVSRTILTLFPEAQPQFNTFMYRGNNDNTNNSNGDSGRSNNDSSYDIEGGNLSPIAVDPIEEADSADSAGQSQQAASPTPLTFLDFTQVALTSMTGLARRHLSGSSEEHGNGNTIPLLANQHSSIARARSSSIDGSNTVFANAGQSSGMSGLVARGKDSDIDEDEARNSASNYLYRLRLCTVVDIFGLLYRTVLPSPLWLHYFATGGLGSFVLLMVYTTGKLLDITWKAKGATQAVQFLIENRLEYGRYSAGAATDQMDCPICFDTPRKPVTLDCEHVFCEVCIAEWLDKEHTCPVCRSEVTCRSKLLGAVKTEASLSIPIII